MMLWRRRSVVIVLAVAILTAGVLWLIMPVWLSPLEQSLVGKWCYTARLSDPDDTTVICDFRPDRHCLIRAVDKASGAEQRRLTGTWYVENETLVCDWRKGWDRAIPIRMSATGSVIGSIRLPSVQWKKPLDRCIVQSVTEARLVVRRPDGSLFTWQRYREP